MKRVPEVEQRLLRMSMRHSVYLMFGVHPARAAGRVAWECVATGALVSFKGRSCVVTDAHIVRGFQKAWETDSRVIFQIGGSQLYFLDVKRRLHSISDGSDLAVFDVSGIEAEVTEGQDEVGPPAFYAPREWPPAEVCVGDVLFFGGYRDHGRHTLDHVRHLLDTHSNLSAIVTDAFPDRYKCRFDRRGWVDALHPDDNRGVGEMDLSGLSGAPMYRLWTEAQREEYRGREFPLEMFPTDDRPADLVGFVMEHSPEWDTLVASLSANVKRDGTLWPNTKR